MSKAKKSTPEAQASTPERAAGAHVSDGGNGTAEAWTENEAVSEAPQAEELSRLVEEVALGQDRLLRLRAEFDNYRRRTLQDSQRLREAAVERVALAILPALDDLERVCRQAAGPTDVETLRRGLDLVLAKFHAQLGQVEVRPFDSLGQPFDPEQHEALTTREDPTQPEDLVLDELVRGYRRGAAVIRHAQVVVNKHAS